MHRHLFNKKSADKKPASETARGLSMSDQTEEEFLTALHNSQQIIFNICLTFTNRQHDNVRDLYQDIVCNLWSAWGSFRHQSSPQTWIYRIALNTATGQLRRHRRTPQIVSIDDSILVTLTDPEENKLYDELYHLIDLLDNEDKQLLFLYLDRHSMKEIAQIVQSTEDAVKHRIMRLKRKLINLKEAQYGTDE